MIKFIVAGDAQGKLHLFYPGEEFTLCRKTIPPMDSITPYELTEHMFYCLTCAKKFISGSLSHYKDLPGNVHLGHRYDRPWTITKGGGMKLLCLSNTFKHEGFTKVPMHKIAITCKVCEYRKSKPSELYQILEREN